MYAPAPLPLDKLKSLLNFTPSLSIQLEVYDLKVDLACLLVQIFNHKDTFTQKTNRQKVTDQGETIFNPTIEYEEILDSLVLVA